MNSQNLRIVLLVVITSLLTFFATRYFIQHTDGNFDNGGTRSETTICSDYESEPPAVLTMQMIKKMIEQYKNVQLNNIQTAATNAVPTDARAIWFDLETLKKFLYHVEHNVNKNYTESQGKKIGIRIYYAAYPNNEEMKRMASSQSDPDFTFNPAYQNLHTLVMIPTITGTNGENYDFNPLDKETYIGFANMNKLKRETLFNNSSYSSLIFGPEAEIIRNSDGTTSARNHGHLYPPGNIIGFGF